ncbi:MAG: signal peptidase I [Thermoleophilia bacterium]
MTEHNSGNRFEDPHNSGDKNPGSQIPSDGRVNGDGGWVSHPPAQWTPAPRVDYPDSTAGPGTPLEHQAESSPQTRNSSWYSPRRLLRDLIIPLVFAFALAMIVQATVAKPYQIPSPSMYPTIQVFDRILANRLIYRFHGVQRGDVIVFRPPVAIDPETPYVKRVAGLPGETVEIRGGKTIVNGEEFVVEKAANPSYTRPAEVVPEGMLFVLGDNRNESQDSHIWGYVPVDNVIGRADVIYWPPEHMQTLGN